MILVKDRERVSKVVAWMNTVCEISSCDNDNSLIQVTQFGHLGGEMSRKGL